MSLTDELPAKPDKMRGAKYYLGRRDTRWDPYPQREPMVAFAHNWEGFWLLSDDGSFWFKSLATSYSFHCEITEVECVAHHRNAINARADVVASVERNPGVTEANVRSNLRSEHGDSTALDAALASGEVVRSGSKLYAKGGK